MLEPWEEKQVKLVDDLLSQAQDNVSHNELLQEFRELKKLVAKQGELLHSLAGIIQEFVDGVQPEEE